MLLENWGPPLESKLKQWERSIRALESGSNPQAVAARESECGPQFISALKADYANVKLAQACSAYSRACEIAAKLDQKGASAPWLASAERAKEAALEQVEEAGWVALLAFNRTGKMHPFQPKPLIPAPYLGPTKVLSPGVGCFLEVPDDTPQNGWATASGFVPTRSIGGGGGGGGDMGWRMDVPKDPPNLPSRLRQSALDNIPFRK